ncbi:MAG: DUF1236 domain-containing protein [Alphaproteobacteria bacterium]|nr:MAG: DUF1236 domain-containing protein [Alphaproteobacteria bacterium]
MKRTLLMSVAAFALAAGSTVALSQGGGAGGNTPMANPSAPSGGQDTPGAQKGQKGAQERTIPEKQKSTQQQSPAGKGSTTGQAQEEKSSPSTTKQSQDNKSGQPSTSQQSQQKSGQPSTTQQSQERGGQAPSTQQSQSPSTGGSKQGTAERSGAAGSSVSLTTEQKTKIRTTVLTSSAPRVTNVNFDVRVGTVVPRTVRVAPLPATIIEIEPQWRGYMYFVYNDEIIVVEPGSLRIVAVLLV